MDSGENMSHHRPHPSHPHRMAIGKAGEHEYQVGFYPGFASRIRVNGEDLYRQAEGEAFVLPSGATRPWSSHAVELTSRTKGYTVVLHVDDPQHVVEKIVVKLRDPAPHEHFDQARGRVGGGVKAHQGGPGGAGDTVEIDNTPTICPPMCG
jgi:hypothetical protein